MKRPDKWDGERAEQSGERLVGYHQSQTADVVR